MQRKKKYIFVLLIAMLAGFIFQPVGVRADLAHGTTVTSSTGSFYRESSDGKYLVDGDVFTMAHSSTDSPNWFLINLARSLKIETILIYNRENQAPRLIGTIFSVGDQADPTAHTPCQTSLPNDSSVFTCGLTGQYIGINQPNGQWLNIMEVRAYLWKNIAPDATTLNEGGCYTGNCASYGAINIAKTVTGWTLKACTATKCSASAFNNPVFKYDLGSEKFIKAVVSGGFHAEYAVNWTAYVGSNASGLDASYTACVGTTSVKGLSEVSCNALGQFLIIQGPAAYLDLTQLAIFEGCDCAGATQWPNTAQGFPASVEVGQTLTFNQTPLSQLQPQTKTPWVTCNFEEQCPQSLAVTLQTGAASPSFISVSGTTLTASPTLNSQTGTYLLKATLTTHEGISPDGVAFLDSVVVYENLQLTISPCQITAVNHVSTPWSTINVYKMGTTAVNYALPTYSPSDTECQNSITYSLLQTNGQAVPSYLSIVGSDIVFSGGTEAEVLAPYTIKVIATDSVSGVTNEEVTFEHTMDRQCNEYALVAQTIADFTVKTGESFTRTHSEFSDGKSVLHGNTGFSLCGSRSYQLIDTATGVAPTFVTHGVDPSAANTYKIVATPMLHQQPDQVFNLKLVVTLQNSPTVTHEELFTVTVVDPCLSTIIITSSEPAAMEVVLQKGNVLQTIPDYDDSVTQTERQAGSPITCGTIAYTLVDSTGAAPTFATVATDGTSLTITGSEDAASLGPHALTLKAALVLYPGIAAKESPFTLTMTDLCLTTVVIGSTEPADMSVILSRGNVLQTIANYDDQVSKTEREGGSPLTCGTIAYTLVDSTGAAPTYATVVTDGTTLTITGRDEEASAGPHVLTLRAVLVDYPGIAAKVQQFTMTLTKLCQTTVVIVSTQPEDMEIGLANGREIQSLSAYDDQVSSDERAIGGLVRCGPIVLTLEDSEGKEPSFCSLQTDEESSQVVLIVTTEDENDVGEHEISLVATLERYPVVEPMRSVFNVKITPPVVLPAFEELEAFEEVEEPVEEGTPPTLAPSPESMVQIIQGYGWKFVLTVSDLEDDFDREEVVVDGPAADAFTYDEGTKTLETVAGQKPAEQPLSLNEVKITLFDKAGNEKEYKFEVEIITKLQLQLDNQKKIALENERKSSASSAQSATVVKVEPPKLFAKEFTKTGGLKISFDKALMIPDFMKQIEVTDLESETKTEPNARRRLTEQEKEPEPTLSEKLSEFMKFELIRGDEESSAPMEDLSFKIEVKEFEEKYLLIRVIFENPLMVSVGAVSDILRVTIIDTTLFMDPLTGLTIEEGTQLEFKIPAQFPSEAIAQATESSMEFTSNTLKTSSLFFVLIAIVLSVSMKQLWNLLNVIQVVAYLRIAVNWPANADTLMEYLEEAVTMRKTFKFAEGLFVEQLEEAKESSLWDSMALFIIVFALLVLLAIVYFVSRYLVKKYPSLEEKRQKLKRALFYNSVIRYLLVSNLKLTHQSLSFFFVTFVYTTNEIGAVEVSQAILFGLIFAVLVCWLFVMAFVLEKYRYELEGDNMRGKIGSLYKGISVEERSERLYNVVFCLRRMCLVLIMLSLKDYHYFKVQAFILLQTFYFIYIGWVQPHTEKLFNWLEMANETLLMILGYTLFFATNYLDPETQFLMGWSTISVTMLIFALNFGYLFSLGFKAIRFAYRVRQYEKKHGCVPKFVQKQRETQQRQREQQTGQMSEATKQVASDFVHPFEQIHRENIEKYKDYVHPFEVSPEQQQRLRDQARELERGNGWRTDLENVKEEHEPEDEEEEQAKPKPIKTSQHREEMHRQASARQASKKQASGRQAPNKQVQGRVASNVVRRLAKDEVLVEDLEGLTKLANQGETEGGHVVKRLGNEDKVPSGSKPVAAKFYRGEGFGSVEPVVVNLPPHKRARTDEQREELTITNPTASATENKQTLRKTKAADRQVTEERKDERKQKTKKEYETRAYKSQRKMKQEEECPEFPLAHFFCGGDL